MGTRADFYVGRGETAEWLGSIGYDGYPDGVPEPVFQAETEADYRAAVAKILGDEEGTTPNMGWPWPWENSRTTDYAYTWNGSEVLLSSFGESYHTLAEEVAAQKAYNEADEAGEEEPLRPFTPKSEVFPDMTGRQKVAMPGDPRSGLMGVSLKR